MAEEKEIRSALVGRVEPPAAAVERTMLISFLAFQRATVRVKVDGLSDDQARRPLLTSSPELTPAGLLRHLTAVERAWFRIVMAGETVEELATTGNPASKGSIDC